MLKIPSVGNILHTNDCNQYFSDEQLALQCIDYCADQWETCDVECKKNSTCAISCSGHHVDCIESCPYQAACPTGCIGCSSHFCKCYPGNAPGSAECERYYSNRYDTCVLNCGPGNVGCYWACSHDYDTNKETCPCGTRCPGGCPCPEYECPLAMANVNATTTVISKTISTTTTMISTTMSTAATTQKAVLIIHFQPSSSSVRPLISKGTMWHDGKEKKPIIVYNEKTEVHYSCSITWKGDFFIYGGDTEESQISKLNGCKLERIGTLPFPHYWGTCANVNDEAIYLCFDASTKANMKKCRKTSKPTGDFYKIAQTTYNHQFSRIGAAQGKII